MYAIKYNQHILLHAESHVGARIGRALVGTAKLREGTCTPTIRRQPPTMCAALLALVSGGLVGVDGARSVAALFPRLGNSVVPSRLCFGSGNVRGVSGREGKILHVG